MTGQPHTDQPLTGQWIVITRAARQARPMREKLEALGARVSELPTIEIQPVEDLKPLDEAIQRIGDFSWLIFTSVNGVRYFHDRLSAAGLDFAGLSNRICAIGPATGRAVEERGGKVHLLPEEYVAESLASALQEMEVRGREVLLPRAAAARDVLPDELTAQGAKVLVIPVYRTVVPAGAAARANEIFGSRQRPDWITFTSSSTVSHFVQAAGAAAASGVAVASIGPVTSATARRLGLEVSVEAEEYTIDGLISALLEAVSGRTVGR